MEWVVRRGSEVIVQLTLPAEFLEWLAARSREPAVNQIDPYRDTVLDGSQQTAWLRVLRQVRTQATAELRHHHESHSHLPREPVARRIILDQLVAQDLTRDPYQRTLDDMSALFELAFDSGASIQAIGD